MEAEGLGPPLLVIAAWLFLREPLSLRTILGMLLVGVGIVLVSELN